MGSLQELVCIVNAKGVITQRTQANIEILQEAGFLLLRKETMELSAKQVAAISTDEKSKVLFSMGPVVALLLRRENAFDAMAGIREHLDDMYYSLYPYTAMRDQHIFFRQEHVLERSLVILKPGYSQDQSDLVAEALRNAGFVVVAENQKVLSDSEANTLFPNLVDDIKYMTRGLSSILVVEKPGAVVDLLLLLGPSLPSLARQIAPNSLRAKLGQDAVKNGVYASPSAPQSIVDIELMFPNPFPCVRTLGIVQPEAFRFWDEIKLTLEERGFHLLLQEEMTLSLQRAEQFYAHTGMHSLDPNWGPCCTNLSSGPVRVLLLYKPAAVDSWIKACGSSPNPAECRRLHPTSLRARFGTDPISNGFYFSADIKQAEADINFFFPQLLRAAVPNVNEVKTIIRSRNRATGPALSLHEVLVAGLTHLCQTKPTGLDAITELAQWLLRNNPNQPKVEIAEEEPETPSLASQIEDASGEELTVTCVFGSADRAILGRLCQEFDFELINVAELVESAKASGSELGRVLKATTSMGRPAPSHMVMTLLRSAIIKAGKSRFLLCDFPLTINVALAFEEELCPISLLVYFEVSEAALEEEALSAQRFVGVPRNEQRTIVKSQIKAFHDDIAPILEHYSAFGKMRSVSAESDAESLWSQLSSLFTPPKAALPAQLEEMPIPPRKQQEKPKLDDDD